MRRPCAHHGSMANGRLYRRTKAGISAWQLQDARVPLEYRRVLGAIDGDVHPDTLRGRLPFSAAGLADLLGLDPDQFEGYLEPVPDDTDPEERVFPDDLFPRLNPWVRVDFLRAIGIEYPIPAQTASGVFCLLVPPGSTTVNRLGIPQPGDPIPPIDPSLLRLN